MSSYWLKIASRAEAKNRRIYKPRRFAETRCTYAAVAGKVGALRETHREREIAKGRRPLFSQSHVTAKSFTRMTEKWQGVQFFRQPSPGVARWGWGLHDYFLPSSTSHVFFPLQSNESKLCYICIIIHYTIIRHIGKDGLGEFHQAVLNPGLSCGWQLKINYSSSSPSFESKAFSTLVGVQRLSHQSKNRTYCSLRK